MPLNKLHEKHLLIYKYTQISIYSLSIYETSRNPFECNTEKYSIHSVFDVV